MFATMLWVDLIVLFVVLQRQRRQRRLLSTLCVLCRPEICYGPPQIAGNSATHATLSQVLQQIDHHLDQY